MHKKNSPKTNPFERGQGVLEFGLILAMMSIAAILALSATGHSVADIFQQVVDGFQATFQSEETELPPVEEFTVQVVDAYQQGIAGAQVQAYQGNQKVQGMSAVTDADGYVRFKLDDGSYRFQAYYQAVYFSSETYHFPKETQGIIETGQQEFTVKVIAENGTGIPGCKVLAYQEGGTYTGAYAVTNSLGTALIPLVQGNYQFSANFQGGKYLSAVYPSPAVSSGVIETHRQSFPVLIVNAAGEPMKDLYIAAYRDNDAYSGISSRSDASGTATLELAEGKFKFRTPYLNQVYWSDVFNVHRDLQGVLTIPEKPFPIQVVDGKGKGMSNIGVYAYDQSGTNAYRYATTDSSGKTSINLTPGSYKFRAVYQSTDTWTEVYNLFSDTSALIQIRQNTFSVKVIDTAGNGIPNVAVLAYNSGGKYVGVSATTNASGEALLEIGNGSFQFSATVQNQTYWSEKINTNQDQSVQIQVKQKTYTISVTDKNKKPFPNAVVYVRLSDDSSTGLSGTTDDKGEISFTLTDGSYKFRIDANGSSYISSAYTLPNADPIAINLPIKVSQ